MKSLLKVALGITLFANAGAFLPAQTSAVTQEHHNPKKSTTPSVETQIQQMRQDLQSQIDDLKTRLAAKDAQIEALQSSTQVTQDKTATVTAQIQATDLNGQRNAAAMEGIRSSINGLQTEDMTLVSKVEQTQKAAEEIKKNIDEPTALRYKGITIVPSGFLAA